MRRALKTLLLALFLLAPAVVHAKADPLSARQKHVAGAILMALGGALTVSGISLLTVTGTPWKGPGYDHEDTGVAGLATIIAGPPLLLGGLGLYFEGDRAQPVKVAATQLRVEF